MTQSEKKKMLKWNTLLWLAAMVLPAVLEIALGSTKFPWFIILPLLLLGPLLASNNMLATAMGRSAEDPATGREA